MPATQKHVADLYAIADFIGNVRGIYDQATALKDKIERYAAASAAVAGTTATERQQRFVATVQASTPADVLVRIGNLLPMLTDLVDIMAANHGDLIAPPLGDDYV